MAAALLQVLPDLAAYALPTGTVKTTCVLTGLLECQLVEFNGEGDHVHLLVSHPTKVSVADLSRLLKGVSARLLRKEFWPQIKTMLWGDHFWSPSYCAVSAGGAPLEVIKRYIEDQNRPTTAAQLKTSKAAHIRWKTHQLR